MKIVVLILTFVLFNSVLMSQPLAEGRIVYDIKVSKETDPQIASMIPKEAFLWFKKGKSRFEMNMLMGTKNITISDEVAKKTVVLMDFLGNKYAHTSTFEEPNAEAKKLKTEAKVTNTNETKIIAGYKCTKYIVEMADKSGKKSQFEIWITKELAFSGKGQEGPLSKIDGAALEFSIAQGPITMTLTAREAFQEKVSDDKFTIPAGYKEMTIEELKMLTGGR